MNRAAALSALGSDAFPVPGGGATAERQRRLFAFGRTDLSLARILEAHTDALAILSEARHPARPAALYGVWASDGPNSKVNATQVADGRWRLSGIKQYCSGATFCTSALVTAHHPDGVLLFDLSLAEPGVYVEPSTWTSPAFADTATAPVRFDGVEVSGAQLLGPPGWYLDRPGFWHGAIGPAACWAGGAASLADSAARLDRKDPHSRAHVAALQAGVWGLEALLERAAREIDGDPQDLRREAQRRALIVRHLVERRCTEMLDLFGRATGPQLLAFDAHAGRQYLSLTLYIRQCHAERDLVQLAPHPQSGDDHGNR